MAKQDKPTPQEQDANAAPKKAFALRISAHTLAQLERWAAQEYRSVNGQIEYLLAQAIKDKFGG